jgi:hypothetical protein
VLGFWDLGFRNVTNSKRPIMKPEDLDGLKIRVIPNPVFLDTFKAFKANPVPMPFAELYGALESKAVDGQENPFAVIASNKFYEVQKYVSGTNHVYAANIDPGQQALLGQALARRAQDHERRSHRSAKLPAPGQPRGRAKAVGELQAKGMQYNDVPPAELAACAPKSSSRLPRSSPPPMTRPS